MSRLRRKTDLEAYRQYKVLHCHLDLDPLLVAERWPHEVRFGDGGLVWMEDDLGLFVVDMKTAKKQDQTRKRSVAGDGLQPVVCAKCSVYGRSEREKARHHKD